MSIVWQNVVDVAPEATTVPAGSQTMILALVETQIDDTAWADMADFGRAWLGAHYAALYLRGGSVVGPLEQQVLGPMSVTYAIPAGLKGPLATTKYGVEYSRLIDLLPGSLGFVP